MSAPLVSVIMAVFNGHDTLEEALQSICEQSVGDWETIIVDDGSSVATEVSALVHKFNDHRLKLIRLQKNTGLPNALNVAIENASGRFLARMDADDIMLPERLHSQIAKMQEREWSICGAAAHVFGVASGVIRNPCEGSDLVNTFLGGNPFLHPTVMFDRSRLPAVPYYDSTLACEEDYDLWARLITKTNCGNLAEPLLRYRVTSTGNANNTQKWRDNLTALRNFAERFGILQHCPIHDLNIFHISGFVDEPGYNRLREYAQRAEQHGWPKLAWLHGLVLGHKKYPEFFAALNDVRHFNRSIEE
jgi:glycosyltransferase involved in cell wall biosynthesis